HDHVLDWSDLFHFAPPFLSGSAWRENPISSHEGAAHAVGSLGRGVPFMSEPHAPANEHDSRPERAGLVLASLIAVATVANLNLSVANVAIPEIGDDFDSSQTTLNLIAVGYSFGLAASVLWFGALGDRYGRKLLIVVGMTLSIPVS